MGLMDNGFDLAYDLIQLHRDARTDPQTGKISKGVPSKIRCLVPAAFLTAFAHGQVLVTAASKRRQLMRADKTRSVPYHLGSTGMVKAYNGDGTNIAARCRVAPSGSTRIWRWAVLTGPDLDDYLSDAYTIRNRIAHTGSPNGARVTSTWFCSAKGTPASITLMAAEGLLQAAQDVSFMVATTAEQRNWRFRLPPRTDTGLMPSDLESDPRFQARR